MLKLSRDDRVQANLSCPFLYELTDTTLRVVTYYVYLPEKTLSAFCYADK